MIEITAIMTCHQEGLLAGPSIESLKCSLQAAAHAGLTVEPVIVLDRPDDATRQMFNSAPSWGAKVHDVDYGDAGLARNFAVRVARGRFITFLDGDDLWGDNWLTAATEFLRGQGESVIAHSDFNIVFGNEDRIWMHQDSREQSTDLEYLSIGNYWDALSFAPRSLYLAIPFRMNDFNAGYGHEDWLWNIETISAGIHHVPVPGTVHFKRRRTASQSDKADRMDVAPWPTPFTAHGVRATPFYQTLVECKE